MTGLNPAVDELVEVAVIVTDFELNPVHEGMSVVIRPGEGALAQMNDFVQQMHTESGLLQELPDGVTVEEAQQRVLAYIAQHVPAGKQAMLAGNTIGTDRMFLAAYMPVLNETLHYRTIDVSSIKELARRWYPAVYFNAPKKTGGHRALADIFESIRELAYYRSTVFCQAPGPSGDESKRAAATVMDNYAQKM